MSPRRPTAVSNSTISAPSYREGVTFGNTGFAYPAALGAQIAAPSAGDRHHRRRCVGNEPSRSRCRLTSQPARDRLRLPQHVVGRRGQKSGGLLQQPFYRRRYSQPGKLCAGSESNGRERDADQPPAGYSGSLPKTCLKSRKPTVLEFLVDGKRDSRRLSAKTRWPCPRFLSKYAIWTRSCWVDEGGSDDL